MQDDRDQDERAAAERVRPWVERCDRLIRARLLDARSHAWHALTGVVVNARDGQATRLAARSTRSYGAARERLAELRDGLLDAIQDARADFYRAGFVAWEGKIPGQLLDERAGPTRAGERNARSLLIHGRDLKADLSGSIEAIDRDLVAAITLAGLRTATDRQARDHLDGWAARASMALQRQIRTLISDSDVAIYWAVGRSLILPEFREDE